MNNITYSFIVACDLNGGIGKNGTMAWHITEDLKRFRDITRLENRTNVVIMGKCTWESLGSKPLYGRYNIVISKTLSSSSKSYVFDKGVYFIPSLEKALSFTNGLSNVEKPLNIFVIGGEQLYKEALNDTRCVSGFLTIIKNTYNCDKFFPKELMDNYETIYDGEWLYENNNDNDIDIEYRFINVIRK
jgi:dihydrofolate reductase